MEWHGALLKMNGTGQRILTVIIWFTLNDNFYQAIKLVQIQRMKRSLDGRVSGQSGPVLSAVHRLLVLASFIYIFIGICYVTIT